MRAIGHRMTSPAEDPEALEEIEVEVPSPGPRDLLVRVEAVSVNPVDAKIRRRKPAAPDAPLILGWDAAGVVEAAGAETTRFRPGDRVWFAGDVTRQGCDAEMALVDERVTGRRPETLTAAEAAAMPLTGLTAWEALFERLETPRGSDAAGGAPPLLIVGGAGGVGSMAIQLARALTGATVVATASRRESRDWALALGAHHVIDHARPLSEAWAETGLPAPGRVFSTTGTGGHWPEIAALLAPQGRVCVIDDPGPIDPMLLKQKSGSLHIEFMFTRTMFATDDIAEQGAILDAIAGLVDSGAIKSTLRETLGPLSAETLREAHRRIESGRVTGKLVLTGF